MKHVRTGKKRSTDKMKVIRRSGFPFTCLDLPPFKSNANNVKSSTGDFDVYIKAATIQISIRFKGTIQRIIHRINMSRFILALLAILAIFSASSMAEAEACPRNEVWNDCGTACPPSCENPNPICTMQCVPSCQCAEGLIRNNRGKCIPRSEC